MEDLSKGFSISYHSSVITNDIPRLSREWKIRIKKTIAEKLTFHPEIFGKPLHGSLVGHRSLRVGEYRIIFVIENRDVRVRVIGHRREVYPIAEKRVAKYF